MKNTKSNTQSTLKFNSRFSHAKKLFIIITDQAALYNGCGKQFGYSN